MGKIKGLLEDEMPREKLMKLGPQSLTDVELLAIILRTGTKEKNVIELSREILKKFSPQQVSRKTFQELLEFKGIKQAKACQIVTLFELSRRLSNKKQLKKFKINSSQELYEYLYPDFANLTKERLMLVLTDTKNQIIRKEWFTDGGLNYSVLDSREIIKKVLDYDAFGFFLIHNHPSGDCKPSQEDLNITIKLKEAAELLNIRLMDHIIIGDDYFSFYESDLL